MNNKLNFGIERLLYKGEFKKEFKKYVLLEKLLLTLNNSTNYNTGDFDNIDAHELISIYKQKKEDFSTTLYYIYEKYCQQSKDSLYRENFNKMTKLNIKSARKPNIHLLNSFADILIRGYTDCTDGQYHFEKPLENFSDYNNASLAYHYIAFCKAVSTIKREPLKAYDIESGNSSIRQLTTDDLPLITDILNQKIYISHYIQLHPFTEDAFEYEDSEQQTIREEIYGFLPWELPHYTLADYKTFQEHQSDTTYITNILENMEDRLIHWLYTYGDKIILNQDLFFLQILFLLTFVSDITLDEYTYFTPSHPLNISNTKITKYYKDIQRINSLPSIDYLLQFNKDIKSFLLSNTPSICSLSVPPWLLFAIYHLSDKRLQAAKNLYITIVLRKRYHKQKDNDSFPPELLDLLRTTLPNIDSIYELCK